MRDWHALPAISEVKNSAVISCIEKRNLMGRGIGLIDAHLLCAAENHADTRLWSGDKNLKGVAEQFSPAYAEPA